MNTTNEYNERVVDLTEPSQNRIYNMTSRSSTRVLRGPIEAVREIDGSFALLARDGKTVRMARIMESSDALFSGETARRPALIVADRIDTIHQQLKTEGLAGQFHPSLPNGACALRRWIHTGGLSRSGSHLHRSSRHNATPSQRSRRDRPPLHGRLGRRDCQMVRIIPNDAPIGVAFSGGIDSGFSFSGYLSHHAQARV
jgi:asparagine synthase (glutamine-hydrolysing)